MQYCNDPKCVEKVCAKWERHNSKFKHMVVENNYCFKSNRESHPYSSGTGLIVSREGHILTNHHITDSCDAVTILHDNNYYEARVVDYDIENDFSLLISDSLLPLIHSSFIPVFSKEKIKVNNTFYIVSYGYEEQSTKSIKFLTSNVDSILSIEDNFFKINPNEDLKKGNSGSPIYDEDGKIFGVVNMKNNYDRIEQNYSGMSVNKINKFLEFNKIKLNYNFIQTPSKGIPEYIKNLNFQVVSVNCGVNNLNLVKQIKNNKIVFRDISNLLID